MSRVAIDEARSELEAAQSALEAALRAWDESVSELWRTSLALTQAQKRVTRAHELLRSAIDVPTSKGPDRRDKGIET
jgi:exonuclease VII small subunit